MEWNSPDPAYQEFLTADQMEQIRQRREDRKGALMEEAFSSPERKNFDSQEKFDKVIAGRDEALKALKGSGLTYEEARIQLIEYWKRNHGSAYERQGGRWVLKESIVSRLRQAKKELGVK
jgi:hypothetical protein